MYQDGGNGGIDTAAQGANHAVIPYFRSNRFRGFFNEGRTAPFLLGLADAEKKIAKHFGAAIGVTYFGVEFNGIDLSFWILDCGDSVLRASYRAETVRQPDDVIAMTVPDAERLGKFREELGGMLRVFDIQNGAAVFAALGWFHFSAQMVGEPLHAVADAEHRNAEREDARITFGSLCVVYGTGAAGEHDSRRFEFANFIERGRAWENRGEDLLFADAASDELGVLAAEVENDYAAEFGVGALLMLLHLRSAGHCPLFINDRLQRRSCLQKA
jgi:hypothetical protein